jgi:hypothetical protein
MDRQSPLPRTILNQPLLVSSLEWMPRLENAETGNFNAWQLRNSNDRKPRSEVQSWLVWIALATAVLVALSRLFGD